MLCRRTEEAPSTLQSQMNKHSLARHKGRDLIAIFQLSSWRGRCPTRTHTHFERLMRCCPLLQSRTPLTCTHETIKKCPVLLLKDLRPPCKCPAPEHDDKRRAVESNDENEGALGDICSLMNPFTRAWTYRPEPTRSKMCNSCDVDPVQAAEVQVYFPMMASIRPMTSSPSPL